MTRLDGAALSDFALLTGKCCDMPFQGILVSFLTESSQEVPNAGENCTGSAVLCYIGCCLGFRLRSLELRH